MFKACVFVIVSSGFNDDEGAKHRNKIQVREREIWGMNARMGMSISKTKSKLQKEWSLMLSTLCV